MSARAESGNRRHESKTIHRPGHNGVDQGRSPLSHALVLELDDVSIRYPGESGAGVSIVEHFGLAVAPGHLHCLAGRSGSGKTSLLTVSAGLSIPTSGDVRWNGESIAHLSEDRVTQRRRGYLGYLDQGGVLLPGLTALENVLLPAVPDRQTTRLECHARELLERLGVTGRASHRPHQLSGGERQRVAFARALLLSPAILMIDEPTASLDRANADVVIALLTEFAAAGTAILVSSHDPALIGAADSVTELA